MDDLLKKVIISKAAKIFSFELQSRSDEKFYQRKEQLDKRYAEAKKNYLLTSDESYKVAMKKIKRMHFYNVSKTEYELCKNDLKQLKEKYYNEADNEFWSYIESLYKIKL